MDEGVNQPSPRNYSEIFESCFPFYLSIGMSATEYWEGDNDLPRQYRKAEKMRQEQINHNAWLHGLYVYDAIMSGLSHLSSKKNEHHSYAEKPYSFTPSKKEEEQKKEEAKAQAEVWMKTWVSATQKMFEKK